MMHFTAFLALVAYASVAHAAEPDPYFFATSGTRSAEPFPVQWSKTFTTKYPANQVPIGLSLLAIYKGENPRVRAYADSVARADDKWQGFNGLFHLDSWGNTYLDYAGCTWLDASIHSRHFQFGQYHSGLMNSAAGKSTTITFARPYKFTPNIIAWMTALDSEKSSNTRIQAVPASVTTTGFRLDVSTWSDSTVNNSTFSWISVPADSTHSFTIQSGQFTPLATSPATFLQTGGKGWTQVVQFNPAFDHVPRVMVALNKLDMGKEEDIRIHAYPHAITKEGMTLFIETWSGSILNSAGVGWIAVDDNMN